MPDVDPTAAARTALQLLIHLREIVGASPEVQSLNAALDVAIDVAERTLRRLAQRPEPIVQRLEEE